jgi:hypothetical protein
MLSCVSQCSYFLFACVGIQKGYVGHCLVVGEGGRSDSLSAETMPHVYGCAGSFHKDVRVIS